LIPPHKRDSHQTLPKQDKYAQEQYELEEHKVPQESTREKDLS